MASCSNRELTWSCACSAAVVLIAKRTYGPSMTKLMMPPRDRKSLLSPTVSVGVPTFLVRGDVYFWGSMMGACLIVSIPIAIIYNFFVDRFVAGFTVGAIK